MTKFVSEAQLRWQCSGKGKPLLLLSPLNMNIKAWEQQISLLEHNGYDVHVPIYPGHLSNPLKKQLCNFTAIIHELRDYIAQHWPGQAIPLVGWSLGGSFALGLACLRPDQISSLVLVSNMVKPNKDLFINAYKLRNDLNLYIDSLGIFPNSQMRFSQQLSARASTQVLMHYFQMLSTLDFRSNLPGIMIPSIVVHGQRDPVIFSSDVEEFRKLGNAKLIEFKAAGHFVPLVAAGRFNSLLLDFLDICRKSNVD